MCCSRLDGDINSQIRQKTLIDADVFILRSRAQMNYYSSALQLASLYRYSAHRFFILIQIARTDQEAAGHIKISDLSPAVFRTLC
jgi:hypothetical protein